MVHHVCDSLKEIVFRFFQCASQNCRNILLDLAITECEELVLLHKSTLLKANISGPITKIKFENLQNINISEHHPLGQQFPPEKIITLASLLTVVDTDDTKTIFLLLSNSNAKMISILKEFIDRNEFDFMKHFIVCSSSPLAIYQLRKSFPELLCGLWMEKSSITNRHRLFKVSALIKPIYGALLRYIIAPVIGICVVFIHKEEFNLYGVFFLLRPTKSHCFYKIFLKFIFRHISNLWRNVGVRPVVYPVNSPNEKRYYQQVTQTQYLTDSLRSEPQLLLMDKSKKNGTIIT